MSERDNFAGGFLFGTLVGSVVGGIVGAVLAMRTNNPSPQQESDSLLKYPAKSPLNSQDSIEDARLSLEEKINQLNHAIDDVRVTLLKNVNDPENEVEKK
jgi:hypothetical protein